MLQLTCSSFETWPAGWREQSAAWLSAGERERLALMRSPARSDQFLAGRLLARQLVAERCGRALNHIHLDATAPRVAVDIDETPLCHLSISHTGTYLAVALGSDPVGVDCERLKERRNWHAMVEQYFAPGEVACLQEMAPTEAAREFVRIWTTKEALSKCAGADLARLLAGAPVICGETRWPREFARYHCWSGDLSDRLRVSLVAGVAPETAPAQLQGELRNQPDGAVARFELRAIAPRT